MSELTRRTFLATAAAGVAAFARADGGKAPATGADNPDLEPFDKLMAAFIAENEVPGASLAVTRNGKLVYARGFGYADVVKKEAVHPASPASPSRSRRWRFCSWSRKAS